MFAAIGRMKNRSLVFQGLEQFQGTLALPINVGLNGVHWTLATVSGWESKVQVTYVDPLSGHPDLHAKKVIELVLYSLTLLFIQQVVPSSRYLS